MSDYLEQFAFAKNLFDYKDVKVQDSSFLATIVSIISNIVLVITDKFTWFCDNLVGVSVAAMSMIFVIMIVDYITGIIAAKKRGEKLESKKGIRWVVKFGSYLTAIYIINCLSKESVYQGMDWITYPLNIVKIYFIFHIALWETKSIDENFESIGWKFRIFKLFNVVGNGLTGMIKKKADDAGVEIDDKNV